MSQVTEKSRRSKQCEEEAVRIIEQRGWTYVGAVSEHRRWVYEYRDQWQVVHRHTLARLKDLSCASHTLHIGEKLCRLILGDLFQDARWLYNRRYHWLRETPDGPALELDIYSESLRLACEHNGKGHEDPRISRRDDHKASVCKDRGISLLVIEQPKSLTVANYCRLFKEALDAQGVDYDQARLEGLTALDGGSPRINDFIQSCYKAFTDEVLEYINLKGGTLLSVDGAPWHPGGAIASKTRLKISLPCKHPPISPGAGEMLQREVWCKSCALAEGNRKDFVSKMATLKQDSASRYLQIGVDLDAVCRDSNGLLEVECRCGHRVAGRSWAFLIDLADGWCWACRKRQEHSQELALRQWTCEEEGQADNSRYRCLKPGCGGQFSLSKRAFADFDQVDACCPANLSARSELSGAAKISLDRIGKWLRAIFPHGSLVAGAGPDDTYRACCGVAEHMPFSFKLADLKKAVARKVIDELKSQEFLLPQTSSTVNVAVAMLVGDEGLVFDPALNYAEPARRFLQANATEKLTALDLKQRVEILPFTACHRLRQADYRCSSCSPTGVSKGKSDQDYLNAVRVIDKVYQSGRTRPRSPDVDLAEKDQGRITIRCGNADHPSFSRSLSSWNQIADRYCPACRKASKRAGL